MSTTETVKILPRPCAGGGVQRAPAPETGRRVAHQANRSAPAALWMDEKKCMKQERKVFMYNHAQTSSGTGLENPEWTQDVENELSAAREDDIASITEPKRGDIIFFWPRVEEWVVAPLSFRGICSQAIPYVTLSWEVRLWPIPDNRGQCAPGIWLPQNSVLELADGEWIAIEQKRNGRFKVARLDGCFYPHEWSDADLRKISTAIGAPVWNM